MINLSNCSIAKVKTFFGLRSIDPPVPIDEFLQENIDNLKSLIEKNQIIVIDDHGKEIDSLIWKDYIRDYYGSDEETIPLDENDEVSKNHDEEAIQEELELINKIDAEEKAKIAHKNRLTRSLENCDESSRSILEKGIEHADQKIKELQSERKSVLIRINQKIND